MPLRAIIDGQDVLSPFMTDDEWQVLKSRVKTEKLEVRMPCCNNIGFMRTSSRGLNHFYHKRNNICDTQNETWQHLKAKFEILKACKDAGYDAITEAYSDGWRADILATKNDIKLAFEVQWSPQKLEVTLDRQKRYDEAGVRCCWLFKTPPPNFEARQDLPLFKLDISNDICSVIFEPCGYGLGINYGRNVFTLSDFIGKMLNHRFKFCKTLRSKPRQNIGIVFLEIECWRCHHHYHVYYLHDLKSPCGKPLEITDELWSDEKLYFHPQIIAIARSFCNSKEGSHLSLGWIKKRYSKTVSNSYLSFGCTKCDAICGDFFLQDEVLNARFDEMNAPAIIEREITLPVVEEVDYNHWCFSEDGSEFCCEKSNK